MNITHTESAETLPLQTTQVKENPNLVGRKFGCLTIESVSCTRVVNGKTYYFWSAKCDCGKSIIVGINHLKPGQTDSCNCANHRPMTHIKEYSVWVQMVIRCHDPSSDGYYLYGARGIVVCDRWRYSFKNFYDDMGPRPKGKTLERRNNDGPYSPENVVWATPKEQARNRRTNHMITFKGVTKCMIEFEEEYNLPFGQIQRRLYKGWNLEDAITTPCNKTGPLPPKEFKNNFGLKARKKWVSAWKCSCKWKTPNRDDIAPNDDGEYACPKCGNKNMRDRGF